MKELDQRERGERVRPKGEGKDPESIGYGRSSLSLSFRLPSFLLVL